MRLPTLLVSLLTTALVTSNVIGSAKLLHVGTVAPDVIGLTISDGRGAEYGRQIPYKPHPDDKITEPQKDRWVTRKGTAIGSLVGPEAKILGTFSRLVGEPFDIVPATKPGNWAVTSLDDDIYEPGKRVRPTAVCRKSKPTDLLRVAPWDWAAPVEHTLYLKLPSPLTQGKHYTIKPGGISLDPIEFAWEPADQRSEAVHISHIGFRPDDPAKVAFLSCWLGDGGGLSYPEALKFHVVDTETHRRVLSGTISLAKGANDKTEDAYKRNYNGADVYEMDFSALREPGTYRVFVESVGCSCAFRIADDVWRKAFTVSARGFYHQRSGIPLGPPYTDFKRPRPFHPEAGMNVYASTTPIMDSGNGLNQSDSNFGNLNKGRTNEIVPNAWGGYMDAGDWDRRIQHLDATRLLLDLAILFPRYYETLSLNIPESRNTLPDVVDEALFNLDCYRRMQTPEGGIRGGIESAEHPAHGEGSWQESLPVMAYAPGVWSSYVYAGTAARAALCLKSRHPELASEYQESALRAMHWAETELPRRKDKVPHQVHDARNLAALELLRLTGHTQWHDIFLATTVFKDAKADLFVWQDHEQREAAWVYTRMDPSRTDADVRTNCRNAILREADQRVKQCGQTAFRWTKYPWAPTAYGILSSPDAVSLVRAHLLTGKVRYLRAAVLACQTGLGANPVNICYTTGLGHRWPLHPLHIDSRISLQSPPPGLTVFGPVDPQVDSQKWARDLVDRFCYPPAAEWPTIEAYWDVFWYPVVCEFTIHQPMAANAYVWGYLAARP
ncbi:MAG: glycoside hydrolase family 9 protein [Phycisphaerales bacterium]|nr:MAG: glycoside hydrolase family 9 protein [Phycisphaerales bacterium]